MQGNSICASFFHQYCVMHPEGCCAMACGVCHCPHPWPLCVAQATLQEYERLSVDAGATLDRLQLFTEARDHVAKCRGRTLASFPPPPGQNATLLSNPFSHVKRSPGFLQTPGSVSPGHSSLVPSAMSSKWVGGWMEADYDCSPKL